MSDSSTASSPPLLCKFPLLAVVATRIGGVAGLVIGRAEYAEAPPSYLVRYADTSGQPVDIWRIEHVLRLVADPGDDRACRAAPHRSAT